MYVLYLVIDSMKERMNEWNVDWISGWLDGRKHGGFMGFINEFWTNDRWIGQMNKWIRNWRKWINEWMKEWVVKWVNGRKQHIVEWWFRELKNEKWTKSKVPTNSSIDKIQIGHRPFYQALNFNIKLVEFSCPSYWRFKDLSARNLSTSANSGRSRLNFSFSESYCSKIHNNKTNISHFTRISKHPLHWNRFFIYVSTIV